jgi:hypothetical protein
MVFTPWRYRLVRLASLIVVAVSVSACASLRADTTAVRPPLDAPVPPPREVSASPDEPGDTPPTPVIVPPGTVAPPRPPRQPVSRPVDKPDAPPPAVPDPATAKLPEGTQGGTLSTSADAQAAERRVRERLGQAVRDLKLVDERSLSSAARAQLDAARRFVTQAEEALAARHYRYAEQLADKAAGIAAGLLKR